MTWPRDGYEMDTRWRWGGADTASHCGAAVLKVHIVYRDVSGVVMTGVSGRTGEITKRSGEFSTRESHEENSDLFLKFCAC